MLRNTLTESQIIGILFLMDKLDRKILSILQDDGRISTTDLASTLGLSLSSCHRRLKELESSKAITHYRAVIDPTTVGLSFEALIFVTMKQEDRDTIASFENALQHIPNVILAQRLFGDPDYLLRVRTTDLDAFALLRDDVLSTLPGVKRMNSTLVMKNVVLDRAYPTNLA